MSQAGVIGFNPSSFVLTLTGNSGGPVPPAAGNINILGSGVVTVAGNPGTSTLTISVSGIVASSFPTDSGTAVPAAGVLNVDGDTHNITTTGAGNTINVKLTGITQHSLQVGGASNALTQLGVATNGQLPIGSTGADPVLATITAGTGISVTNGAGSISIATTGPTNPVTTLHTQDGNNVTATAGVINLSGGNNLTTTGTAGPNTATISLTGITQHSIQVGGASNALTQLGVATNGQLPIGSTGADPVLATLTSGNNITVTNGAGSISVAVTGTTNHSLQLGNASGSLTSLGVATNGQLPIGSTGADPVLSTLTAGTGITITNGAGSITIASGSAVAESFPTDSGTATPSAGVLNIDGDTHNITTTGSGNTVNVKLTGITQHSLQVGGASNALTQLGVATNGQLPIGSTGADPVLATLTAGTGISISNGAGSITVSATGTTTLTVTSVNHAASPYTVLTTDEFLAVDVSGGVVTIKLPNAPATGRVFYVKDSTGNAATSNITVTTVGGAVNIDGATSFVMNTAYESISVIFDGTAYEVF